MRVSPPISFAVQDAAAGADDVDDDDDFRFRITYMDRLTLSHADTLAHDSMMLIQWKRCASLDLKPLCIALNTATTPPANVRYCSRCMLNIRSSKSPTQHAPIPKSDPSIPHMRMTALLLA